MRAECLQQNSSSEVVNAGVFLDLVHALADPHQSDQVDHIVHAFERPRDNLWIANVADHQLHFGREIRRTLPVLAMNLRNQIVEGSNTVTVLQQLIRDVGSDESSTTG